MTNKDLKQCLSFIDKPDLFKSFSADEEKVISEAREVASRGGSVDFKMASRVMAIIGRIVK